MKQSKDSRYIKAGLTAFLVFAASIVFYFLIFHNKSFRSSIHGFVSILNPIFYGLVLAYILNPLMQLIENLVYKCWKKTGKEATRTIHQVIRLFSAFAAMLLLFLIIYGLVSLLLPQLIESVRNIIRNYPVYEANVIEWVNNTFGSEDASQTTSNILYYADKVYDWAVGHLPEVDSIVSNVTQYLLGFVRLILNLLLGMIIAIYILHSKEIIAAKTKRMLYAFVPVKTGNRILHNIQFVDEKFGGFIIGKVIDSMIIGVICYISVSIMRMPYTVLIAVVIGVTNIIPFFGPFIGAIPCAILVFVVSPLKSVYFIVFILLLQQFDGNILGPRILGNSTGLSGFMVVIAIVICNGIFGIGGAFFGVPLTATVVGVVQAYIRKKATKKGLPRNIEFYDDLAYIEEESNAAVPMSKQDRGSSLYDRIRRKNTELSTLGVKRFMKSEYEIAEPSAETAKEEAEISKEAAETPKEAGKTQSGTEKKGLPVLIKKRHDHDIPIDPVDVTEEEAASNHNLPVVP